MFKEKVNINTKQVWNLVRLYRLKDGALKYVLQHKTDMTIKRVEYRQLAMLYKQGYSNNYMISVSTTGRESIKGKNGKLLTGVLNNEVKLDKRLTPVALLFNNKGKISEVMLFDEQTEKKVRVTYDQLKELDNRNLVNLLKKDKDGYITFPDEVLRYDIKGNVKLNANQKRALEEAKKVDSALTSKDTVAKSRKFVKRVSNSTDNISEEEKQKEMERLAKLEEKNKAKEHKKKVANRTSGESVEDRMKKSYEEAKSSGVFDVEPEEIEDVNMPKRCISGAHSEGSVYGMIDKIVRENYI